MNKYSIQAFIQETAQDETKKRFFPTRETLSSRNES